MEAKDKLIEKLKDLSNRYLVIENRYVISKEDLDYFIQEAESALEQQIADSKEIPAGAEEIKTLFEITPVVNLKKGDIILWRSSITKDYEIHVFHSDAGYGAKTFTDYNEKDGSSLLVNYSGICGILKVKEAMQSNNLKDE